MKCYGLIVRGDVTPISGSQIGYRVPACMKMDGAFFGPFTYEQLVAGTNITLSAGEYSMQLVGFDGIADCGTGLSTLFAGSGADTYDVAVSESFSFPTTTSVTLDGTAYNPTTTESLTPNCPPQMGGCNGYSICDTFTAVDSSPIMNHPTDTLQNWILLNSLFAPLIVNGHGQITTSDPGNQYSVLALNTNYVNVDLSADFNMGYRLGDTIVQLVGRYDVNVNRYVRGFLIQSASSCSAEIAEYDSGSATTLKSGSVPCSVIDGAGNVSLRLRIYNAVARLDIGTDGSVFIDNSSSGLPIGGNTGTYAGVGSGGTGALTLHQTVDVFRARRQLSPFD